MLVKLIPGLQLLTLKLIKCDLSFYYFCYISNPFGMVSTLQKTFLKQIRCTQFDFLSKSDDNLI